MLPLQKRWAHTGVFAVSLLPLAGLFSVVSWLRRLAYRRRWLSRVAVGVPVIVVGNITAGGSGKTPLAIWLVNWLRAQGYRPGVVSRGYGGSAQGCVEVRIDRSPAEVGDEPLLIHGKTTAPVVVGKDRVAAARTLLARYPGVDVIVSDDGLQHYRLGRSIELAVMDAATGLGNGWPLPAGPLREPRSRLNTVDAVIQVVRGAAQPRSYPSVKTGAQTIQRAWPIVCANHWKRKRCVICPGTIGWQQPGLAGHRGSSTCCKHQVSSSVPLPLPIIMRLSQLTCLQKVRC